MQVPLQISSRNFELPEHLKENIRAHVEDLEKFYDKITSCHVVVETPHHHKHQGVMHHVKVRLSVPGKEIVVNKQSDEDFFVALRDSFSATRRELEDHVRIMRGQVKRHDERPWGRISQLFEDKDYGFLISSDGRDVYFHRNSVLNSNFDELKVGSEVQFTEEEGESGPQATSLRLVHNHV